MKRPILMLWLVGVVAAATGCDSIAPATCPDDFDMVDGVCRLKCATSNQCLGSEVCTRGVCVLPAPTDKPSIATFSVSPNPTTVGASVRIQYVVRSAQHVTLTAEDGMGGVETLATQDASANEVTYVVPGARTLRLVAEKKGESASQELQLSVTDVPPMGPEVVSFTASTQEINVGEEVRLSWVVRNAPSIFLFANGTLFDDNPVGTTIVDMPPVTTTYELRALAADGVTFDSKSVSVAVVGETLVIDSFEVRTANQAREGDNAAITWSTHGAASVTIQDGTSILYTSKNALEAQAGTFLVLPDAPRTSYRFEATSPRGQTESRNVDVDPVVLPAPPQITMFTTTPEVLGDATGVDTDVTVSWTITGPTLGSRVSIYTSQNHMITGLPTSGSRSIAIPPGAQTVLIALYAENLGGGALVWNYAFSGSVETEPNNDPQNAQQYTLTSVTGSLDIALDQDWYFLDVAEGGRVRGRLGGGNGCPRGVRLALMAANNPTPLIEQEVMTAGGQCPRFDQGALPPGDYFLRVSLAPGTPAINPVAYQLRAEIDVATCGDGVTAGEEECDDGNRAYGDACTPLCQVAPSHLYDFAVSGSSPGMIPVGPRQIPFRAYDDVPDVDRTDRGYAVVEIPFNFSYFGYRHRAVAVHTDGYVSFLPVPRNAVDIDVTKIFSGGSEPDAIIAPFAADLVAPGGSIVAWNRGAGTNEELHILMENFTAKDDVGSQLSAEIVLYESGRIEVRYSTVIVDSNVKLQAGIQDETGGVNYFSSPECASGSCPIEMLDHTLHTYTPRGG